MKKSLFFFPCFLLILGKTALQIKKLPLVVETKLAEASPFAVFMSTFHLPNTPYRETELK